MNENDTRYYATYRVSDVIYKLKHDINSLTDEEKELIQSLDWTTITDLKYGMLQYFEDEIKQLNM